MSASPAMRRVVGQRVPDNTLTRVVGGFQGTEGLVRRLWRRLRGQQCLGFEGEHVGVIDGTSLGGHLISVLAEIGSVAALVATEPIPGTGNELSASLRLLHRLAAQEAGCFDYLLGDGLHACENFWKACDALEAKGLVKTSEDEPFACIQQSRTLFDHPIRGIGVGYQIVEGTDTERAVHYRVWQTTALWAETRRRITVARVVEQSLKNGELACFWVLCQDLAINPHKLRRLAHARWFIENNVFKALDDQAHSKHQFSRNPRVAQAFAHLQALAFMAVGAYRVHLERIPAAAWLRDHGCIPLRLLQSVFRLVLSPVNSG